MPDDYYQRTPGDLHRDKSRLLPIGVISVDCESAPGVLLPATCAPDSAWNSLDHILLLQHEQALSAPLASLRRLVEGLYACAFYKFLLATVAVFRIYAVPLDGEGARYIHSWRSQLPSKLLNGKKSWDILREVMDVLSAAWNMSDSSNSVVIPFNGEYEQENQEGNYGDDESEQMLKSVVQDIYSRISVPDLQIYSTPETMEGVPDAQALISHTLHSGAVPGVNTFMYSFQLKSVAKMLEKETTSGKCIVPNFLPTSSPDGRLYYIDTQTSGVFLHPELYFTPRGGILAENMGLGKTLICLALICLTKHEFASSPGGIVLDQKFLMAPSFHHFASLSDLCVRTIGQNALPWKYYTEELPAGAAERLYQNPGYFMLESVEQKPSRSQQPALLRRLYLSSTTLVIVPDNLLQQWNAEITKHLRPDYLRCLFISLRFKDPLTSTSALYTCDLPKNIPELCKYDLVMISTQSFTKIPQESLLLQVYWKRLIIDEGHSMGSNASISTKCNLLHSERRWAVTGTPTSGLTNLHMDEEDAPVQTSPLKRRKYVVKSKYNARQDLLRIGNLVSAFFKIEPFHTSRKQWFTHVVRPLVAQDSARNCLLLLLNALMVRHGPVEIENDLRLPQLHHEPVFLKPSHQNRLSINLFNAVLAVNAVSSEREGSDYMFDPANRLQLRRLVNNLQLASFYWTGFKLSDVEALVSISKHCLGKRLDDGASYFSDHDRALLETSVGHAERALSDRGWRTAAELHEMQYSVLGLPRPMAARFGTIGLPNETVFGAPHLAALQEFYYKNRFADFSDNLAMESKLNDASRKFWDNYWRLLKEKNKFKEQRHLFDASGVRETEHDHNSLHRSAAESFPIHRSTESPASTSETIRHAQILGTGSSKLSYLAGRLLAHQRDNVRSIVFFEYEDSAYYLTECLDLLGIKYILYATFIGASQRANNLAAFDSHDSQRDGGIALIMDLRLAAHGLTIISATRVYMMSPIWQRSVEAQAIKRAHRIGQTREVYVETLVLEGTLEEEIYRRRELSEEDAQGLVIDDHGMQNYVLQHRFLEDDGPAYAEFAAPANTTSDYVQQEEGSLLRHELSNSGLSWVMRLFNQENLEKLAASKKLKASEEELNLELVSGKVEPVQVVRKSGRKSVRF